MSIKLRRFVSASVLFAAGVVLYGRAQSSVPAETDFRRTYPTTPPISGSFAGVALDKLVFPGLTLRDREDNTVSDGGIQLAYAPGNEVGLVLRVAVAPTTQAARAWVDVELHGVQTILAPAPAYGDYAFGDGESLIVSALGNVAYSIRANRDLAGVPRASDVASIVRANVVAGSPSYPSVSVTLPNEVRGTGDITVISAFTPKLRAEGGYVAVGPRLKPFGPGPVAVIAEVTDDLGRVSLARATSIAR